MFYAHHLDKGQAAPSSRKPSWAAYLPFLAALNRKGDSAPTVQGRGDVEQLEFPWLPEAPQGCEETAGRCRGQHFLHIMAAHQELSLVGQQGAWEGQVGMSDCTQPPARHGSFPSLPPSKLLPITPQIPSFCLIPHISQASNTLPRHPQPQLLACQQSSREHNSSVFRVLCPPLVASTTPSRGDSPKTGMVGEGWDRAGGTFWVPNQQHQHLLGGVEAVPIVGCDLEDGEAGLRGWLGDKRDAAGPGERTLSEHTKSEVRDSRK